MLVNLKPFSTNYKLRTTNYKEKGTAHDGINLHATVPFANCDLRDALWASPTNHFITSFWTEVMALDVASSKSLE